MNTPTAIAAWIMLNGFTYFLIAFIVWELNPGHWDGFARFIFAIFSAVITIFCIAEHKDQTQ